MKIAGKKFFIFNSLNRSGGKKKSKKRSSWSRGKIANNRNKKRGPENGVSDKSVNDGSGEEENNKDQSDNEMSEEVKNIFLSIIQVNKTLA